MGVFPSGCAETTGLGEEGLLAFDGLLQVLCEVSGDGHSEVGSGFSESGSSVISVKEGTLSCNWEMRFE